MLTQEFLTHLDNGYCKLEEQCTCHVGLIIEFFVVVIHLELFTLYEKLLQNWSTKVKEQSLLIRYSLVILSINYS